MAHIAKVLLYVCCTIDVVGSGMIRLVGNEVELGSPAQGSQEYLQKRVCSVCLFDVFFYFVWGLCADCWKKETAITTCRFLKKVFPFCCKLIEKMTCSQVGIWQVFRWFWVESHTMAHLKTNSLSCTWNCTKINL